MKTFYNRSLNWINYLLGSLLGLLGFSCDGIGETPDEYGTPWATYQFKGRALDASNQPINNLRVKAIPSNSDLDMSYFPTNHFKIVIEDTDGEANGGLFVDKTTQIEIDDSEYKESYGNWFKGKVTREMDIHLEKQE